MNAAVKSFVLFQWGGSAVVFIFATSNDIIYEYNKYSHTQNNISLSTNA